MACCALKVRSATVFATGLRAKWLRGSMRDGEICHAPTCRCRQCLLYASIARKEALDQNRLPRSGGRLGKDSLLGDADLGIITQGLHDQPLSAQFVVACKA